MLLLLVVLIVNKYCCLFQLLNYKIIVLYIYTVVFRKLADLKNCLYWTLKEQKEMKTIIGITVHYQASSQQCKFLIWDSAA